MNIFESQYVDRFLGMYVTEFLFSAAIQAKNESELYMKREKHA